MARKTKNPGTNRQSMSGTGNSNSAGISKKMGTVPKPSNKVARAVATTLFGSKKIDKANKEQNAKTLKLINNAMDSVKKHMKKLY